MMSIRNGIWTAGVIVFAALLSGCDYWPPALQAQIEQLRAETQTAAADRIKLESELAEAKKERDQVQARMDELTRSNHALSAEVTKLEQALGAERDKVARMTKPGSKATAKAPAKSTAKSTAKTAAKKKPAKQVAKKRP